MEFKKVKLGECVDYILDYRGKTPKKSKTGIPTLSAKSVKNNFIDYDEVYYISRDEYNRFMSKGFPRIGDILMTMEAPLGLVATLDRDDVGLGQRIVTIRGKKDFLDNNYLKFYLQSPKGQHELYSRATGTTVVGISQKNLKNIDIVIPSLENQIRIGRILNNYNIKIEINNKIISNLESQAQAIFKSWFVDFEPFQDGDFVESELGMIPEGWEVRELKDVSKRINGFSYTSKDIFDESNINMITIKNFDRNGGLQNDSIKPISKNSRIKKDHYLKTNDILMACTDLTQKADIIGGVLLYFENENFDNEIFSMDLIKLVPFEKDDTFFFYYYLKNPIFKLFAENASSGTTVLHLSKKAVDNFNIVYPTKKHIDRFNDYVFPIIKKQRNLLNQNTKLAELRDALLPKLMAGEIDVSNIKIEGEEVKNE
ncbi:MAG: restriction endonuclease subunit S [Finegoldia sp.]|uniref:restriction endonuclease subunit S n=1 Tax=Finegoldia sp. TaxID=1981334 RepID=UPI0025EDB69F|nr:restriction endonuclease subunit S [uncultured Finegoldia sp.]